MLDAGGGTGGLVDAGFTASSSAGIVFVVVVVVVVVVATVVVEAAFSGTLLVELLWAAELYLQRSPSSGPSFPS